MGFSASLRAEEALSSVLVRVISVILAMRGASNPSFVRFLCFPLRLHGWSGSMTRSNPHRFFIRIADFVIFSGPVRPVPVLQDAFFRGESVVSAPFFMFFFHVTVCLSARRRKSEFF